MDKKTNNEIDFPVPGGGAVCKARGGHNPRGAHRPRDPTDQAQGNLQAPGTFSHDPDRTERNFRDFSDSAPYFWQSRTNTVRHADSESGFRNSGLYRRTHFGVGIHRKKRFPSFPSPHCLKNGPHFTFYTAEATNAILYGA